MSLSKFSRICTPENLISSFLECSAEIDTSVFYQAVQDDDSVNQNLEGEFSSMVHKEPSSSPLVSQNESFISRLFAFVRRNFMPAAERARNLGIRVRSVVTQVISSVFSLLKIMFQKYLTFINAIENLFTMNVSVIAEKITMYCDQSLSSCKGIIFSMVALTLALTAFLLPATAITNYGRFLVVALSAIIQYFQSFRVTGVAVAVLAILQSFSSRLNVAVSVNNNMTPQYQGVKEDTKDMLCQVLSLAMLFTASTAGMSFPTDSASLDALLRRQTLAYRSYQAWEFMASKVGELLETSSRLVCKYALGVEYTSFEHISEVDELYKEVMDLCSMEKQLQIGRDPAIAMRIEVLYTTYLHLRKVYASNATIRESLNAIGAPLTAYYRRVSNKNPKAHVMRQEPVCFMITGDTGIGKSYLMAPLQQDLLKICGKFFTEGNMEGMVYARCVEQEFWDGYCGQPIVIYDDFGQKVDSLANPNEEFFELIRAVNIFPYQLHSAELADKANNPFQADFVCLNTNLEVFDPQSIISTEALNRRFHYRFKMTIIDEVKRTDGRGVDVAKLQQYRLERGLESYDLSHTRFIDFNTRKTCTYEEMVVMISLKYKEHFDGFTTRTTNASMTKERKLPPNAFSIGNQWSTTGAQPQMALPHPQLYVSTVAVFNQPPAIRRYFLETYRPYLLNSHRFTIERCSSVDEFVQRVRDYSSEYVFPFIRRHQIQPIPAEILLSVMNSNSIEPSLRGREFNEFVRSQYQDFVSTPPRVDSSDEISQSRARWFYNLWHSWSGVRNYVCDNFSQYMRFIGIGLTCGVILSFAAKLFAPLFSSHTFHKSPIVSTLARVILRDGFITVAGQSLLGIPSIGGTVYVAYTLIRDFAKHGIVHKEYDHNCDECNKQKQVLSAVDADKDPLDFDKATTILLETQPEIGISDGEPKESRKPRTKLESDCQEFTYKKTKPEIADENLERLFPNLTTLSRPIRKAEGIISTHTENLILKCSRNMWWLEAHFDDEVRNIGHVFVLKGHDAIINYHFMQAISIHLNNCNDKSSFRLLFKQHGQATGVFEHLEKFLRSAVGKQIYRAKCKTEFYMFKMPTACQLGADLTKHLVRAQDLSKLARNMPFKMFTFEKREDNTFVHAYRDGFYEELEKTAIRDLINTEIEHWYPETARYLMTTRDGDCGSPIFLNSDMFERKLLGFHFAGMQGKGLCSIITFDDIKDMLSSELYAADRKDIQPVLQSLADSFPLKDGSFFLVGEVNHKISHPCKTKLTPSAVHGLFGPPECLPAVLAPPLRPDGPMLKALQKNAGVFEPLTTSQLLFLDDVVKDYFQDCIQIHQVLPYEKDILTFEQACQGIEGNEYFPPLKRSKSAGYPFMTTAKKGKTDWFGTDEWKFDNPKCHELRQIVEDLENQCALGEVPEVYFVATLKDEKRPKEKVLAGKTRAFSACPLHYSVVFRKYFLGFLAFMTRNKIYTECAVGTNVYSKDWERIVDYLNRWNQHHLIAGDFENFDGAVHPDIFERICDIINAFYADGERNAQIRRSLFKVICQPCFILDTFAFHLTHGQPSGNPSTAITNSIYVSLLMRFIYKLDPALKEYSFKKNVRMLTYGDDNIIALSPWLAKVIGPDYFARKLKEHLNITYTKADKTKFSADDKLQDISEISFLKRGFQYGKEENHWFAPLELRSIREMCNWVTRGVDHNHFESTQLNCEAALEELVQHPKDVFQYHSERICSNLTKLGLSVIPPHWENMRLKIALGQFLYEGRTWV